MISCRLRLLLVTMLVLAAAAWTAGEAVATPPECMFWESAHSASIGQTIVFDGGMSFDPDGDPIIDWLWDFGDGNFDSGSLVTHDYAMDGPYTVCLTVTDAGGEQSTCCDDKRIEFHVAPVPLPLEPIDLTGGGLPPPVTLPVTLYCTEENGRTSWMNPDGTGDIMYCRFEYWRPDIGMWELIGEDWEGTQPTLSQGAEPGDPPTSEPQWSWWSVEWDSLMPTGISVLEATVRVTMEDMDGFPAESFFDVYVDLTPPQPEVIHPDPTIVQAFDEGSIIDLECHTWDEDVIEVAWWWQPVPRIYVKGVPLMDQRNPAWPTYCPLNDGAMWCAPTANASCLKWWSANGFPGVWPAARPDWVNRWLLARFMGTSCFDGTTVPGQIRGARNWIAAHGGGLRVSGPVRATPWRFIRELANCREDVLLYWWWNDDPSDGGHEVTGNSFTLKPNPTIPPTWNIDYMDPCGGIIVNTLMDAAGRIEVPPGSGLWHQAWMKTISPAPWVWPPPPPYPPGGPWWPSCEVEPPIPAPCDILYTYWDLNNPDEWSDPDTPIAAGTYLLECVMVDEDATGPVPVNHMMSETIAIEVMDTPPSCDITYEPPMPLVMEPVQFHANGWDGGNPGGIGLEYEWDFGDGFFGPGSDPFHEYAVAADYPVTCTVTDDEGSQAQCTTIVQVQLQPEPPQPLPIPPIDPAWVDKRPPLHGVVTLYCTEANGRTSVGAPVGSADITQVAFAFGPPGGPYLPIGTDTDGMMETESQDDWPPISDPQYDWWSVEWDLTTMSLPEDYYEVKVTMSDLGGYNVDSFFDVYVDVTPPDPEVLHPLDYQTFDEGSIIDLEVHSWDEDVVVVDWWWQPKQDYYIKGVPLLNQHSFGFVECGLAQDGKMWCAPTAWASCLKWWANNGYPKLTQDPLTGAPLTDQQLVSGLAAAMGTSCFDGTTVPAQVAGGRAWIAAHGGGLHVSGPSGVTPQHFRNEIENCKEDVLLGIYWDTGGGHRVTGNSFRNRPDADGNWEVDYMDPSTGSIVTTKMRPDGYIEFPPNSGRWHETDNMITVSPDDPGPWWPSCEVEPPPTGPPYPVCDILYTYWDLNDPAEWMAPDVPMTAGLYLLKCQMMDSTSRVMDETLVIEILDLAPYCNITWHPMPAIKNWPTTFDSNAWDAGNPGGIGLSCSWTFGDGGTGSGLTAVHTYTSGGGYNVTCTVTDDEGSTSTCTAFVRVYIEYIGPDILAPIDPAWTVNRPPLSGQVALLCTEANGNTGVDDPSGLGAITYVAFDYSPDGGMSWLPIGTDTTGMTETESEDWPDPSEPQYGWWTVDWDVSALPPSLEGYVMLRATMEHEAFGIAEDYLDVYIDPTPPKPEIQQPLDYQAFDEGSIIDLAVHSWDEDLIVVDWWWQHKQDWYIKGVPLLNQHNFGAGCPNDGNMYCAPTAWASCLKWWAANGYPNLTAGLTDQQLVSGLAAAMGTSCFDGTTVAGQVAGGRAWIAGHGGGLHVSGPSSVTPQRFRNELENCKEDVLLGIYWDTGGGHRVTGNSFRNRQNAVDLTWDVDYMDPSTGSIVNTKMRPDGYIEFPPGSGRWHETDNMITVSPDDPGPWWPSCEVEPGPTEPPYPPCDILYTVWDLNNPDEWEDPTIPMTPGLYLLKCRMMDSSLRVMEETIVIEILNVPPVCAITYTPVNPNAGDTVSFNANAYDPGGGAVTCSWTFGDGNSATGCLTSHVYGAGGVYTVNVTVCDDEGSCTTCAVRVVVAPLHCRVICNGTYCGGAGMRKYQYEVTAPAGTTFSQFEVGAEDPDPTHYTNWVLPAGWGVAPVIPSLMPHDDFTPHGGISAPTPGACPNSVVLQGPAITSGVFAFDHPGKPHDVGWTVTCWTADCVYDLVCQANWNEPVGMGLGPVHGPRKPPPPVVKPIEPIDPAWVANRPPLTGVVPLFCTEDTGRTGMDDPSDFGDISQVTFEYGPPGGPYTLIGTDTTGQMETESEDWPDPSEPQYNWWSVEWDLNQLPNELEEYLTVRVTMEDIYGQSAESFFDVYVDVTPPKPKIQHPLDYQAFGEGSIIDLAVHSWDEDLIRVDWWWQHKQDWYIKGVPLLNQHNFGAAECGLAQDGKMWCAPTAWASCLKWWAANGYPNLTAGLTDQQLVSGLAAAMGTSCFDGTSVAGQIAGGRAWIAGHGGGLHVSGPSAVTPQRFRNELENCKEDVLLGIYWDTGGGHRVTGNSFRNRQNAVDLTWDIDYMDPSTGTIVTTKMSAAGFIEFPPGSGRWHATDNMITVSPDDPGPWWPSCEVEPPYPACDILYTVWDLNNPDEWEDPTIPMTPGLYLLKCRMTDASGHVMDETIVIEILDVPPICAITYTPAVPKTYEVVNFDANAYDPGGGAVTCTWDFGCGCPPATGCVTSHAYDSPGNYVVTVVVCDDEGTCTTCSVDVLVVPAECEVFCQGIACGGPGPSMYQYRVVAPAGTMFDHWHVGTDDPDMANYMNWVLPPGWVVTGIFDGLFQHDDFTPHGGISVPTGPCPHIIAFGGPSITDGVFGYDHAGQPHDVGWLVECLGADCGGPWQCVEDWTMQVGMGRGPVHAPYVPVPPPPELVPIEPIDPVWLEWSPPLTGRVTLYCTEGTGRTGVDDPGGTGDIARVTFEIGPPGGPYTLIGEDTTGETATLSEAPNDYPPESEHQYNYWSAVLDVESQFVNEAALECRITMEDTYGQMTESFFDVYVDPTPPYPEIQEPVQYQAYEEGTIIPLSIHTWDEDLIEVAWWWQPIQPNYVKGVPLMNQLNFGAAECGLQDGRMWCVPTAWASCLKWWAANGYPGLTAGLTDQQLVSGLAAAMGTSCYDGTTIAGQTKGGRAWIAGHGGGLRVSGPYPGSPWRYIKELANCKEDVLMVIWWDTGGGHEVTGNSFNLIPNADGTFNIDWMDPWGGVIVNTTMNAAGQVEYPPGSGRWHDTEIKTVSPNRPPWDPPPGRPPWWPSCEVEPPYFPCDILITEWDLNNPDEWMDPETPMVPGHYLLRCDVKDASGHMMSETTVIEIMDVPPICQPTYDPPLPTTCTPVLFNANAYEPGGGEVSCQWDFGDGTGRAGCDVVHTYTAPGLYTACVIVSDDEGNVVECCVDVQVIEDPGPHLSFTLAGPCWHMITIPCYPIDPDPWVVFEELRPPYKPIDLLSGNLHRYNRNPDKYVTYWASSPSEFGPITPGEGYWLNLFEDETFCYEAMCSGGPEAVYFEFSGWYMMGSPQPTDTFIDMTEWYQGPVGPYPFSMIMNEWVQDPFVFYRCLPPPSGYYNMGLLPIDDDDHLRQFQGYWMYAFQPDLTMVVWP